LAGVVLAGKTVGDERKRLVTKRQNEAKVAARRYADDVTFQVAKDSRDRLRAVQRDQCDHFTGQAEQMKRSLQESQQAAERAVKASGGERDARQSEITAELAALDAVRRRAMALLPAPARRRRSRRRRVAGPDRESGRPVSAALSAATRRLLVRAIEEHRGHPPTAHRMCEQLDRLDSPLRVTIAGKVKAGKSTLLNALVGEQVAPTDAAECTLVVTWYRDGPTRGSSRNRPRGRRWRCRCAGTQARW
jgi:ATPase subunit of ABC transporter with duplicated ATPase domains